MAAPAGELFAFTYEFKFTNDWSDAVFQQYPGTKTDELKAAIQAAVSKVKHCLRYQASALMSIKAETATDSFKVTIVTV